MRFGVVLPTFPSGATPEGIAAVAEAAERLGFASVWTTDHVILPAGEAGPYREIYEPLLTLAWVAARTARVALGISVIVVPQRNGVVLAKELATLDRLCGGRAIAGVGAGWNEAEFRMLDAGARFGRRGAHLDETLRLWRHLWTTPEDPAGFRGRFYDLPPVAFGPSPARPGGPPVWVGGSSPGARRRAGRFGAAWHPVGLDAAAVAEQGAVVREAAAEAGRPMPAIGLRLQVHLGQGAATPLSANPQFILQGEPAAIVDQIGAYERAGVAEIVCLFGSPEAPVVIEQMERLAAGVLPAFTAD